MIQFTTLEFILLLIVIVGGTIASILVLSMYMIGRSSGSED